MKDLKTILSCIPGLLICLLLFFMADYLATAKFWPFTLATGEHPFGSVIIVLLLGIIIRNTLGVHQAFKAGTTFSLNVLLPLSIVFLGARLKLSDLMQIGATGLILSIVTITFVFVAFHFARKLTAGPLRLTILLSIGTAICGGSAILAAAPVLQAKKSDIVFSVATVACIGLLLMFLLPVFGLLAGLSSYDYGMLAGLSIHQTPQVIAAGFAFGDEAGKLATVVKLARVCMLAPTLFLLGLFLDRVNSKTESTSETYERKPLLPWFLYGFAAMTVLRSFDLLPLIHVPFVPALPIDTVKLSTQLSRTLMIVSMAGLGLDTDITQIKNAGGKSFVIACLVSLALIAFLTVILKIAS